MVTCTVNAPSLICKLNTAWAYLGVLFLLVNWQGRTGRTPVLPATIEAATSEPFGETLFVETTDMTDFHIFNLCFWTGLNEACFCASPFIRPRRDASHDGDFMWVHNFTNPAMVTFCVQSLLIPQTIFYLYFIHNITKPLCICILRAYILIRKHFTCMWSPPRSCVLCVV